MTCPYDGDCDELCREDCLLARQGETCSKPWSLPKGGRKPAKAGEEEAKALRG